MNLKILLPTNVLIDEEATKVIAEAENGAFCLLPRHRDFVAALVPGILTFTMPDDGERHVAVNEGVLIKSGPNVRVSTRDAVFGPALGSLRETVARQFRILDEKERLARSATAKLEADFFRRFLELQERSRG